MKHKNHTVKVYQYNPLNLKEVIDTINFKVEYVPTKKWNIFLVLINREFCKYKINLCDLDEQGGRESSRKVIAQSIYNYVNNDTEKFQNRTKLIYPNNSIFVRSNLIFNKKLLNMGDFKSRDGLTKYKLTNINNYG